MPKTPINPDTLLGDSEERFPQLKLKAGERSRIWLPPERGTREHMAMHEWVHEIKAPVFEHGEAKKETRERDDGTTYEAYKTSFIGRPICLGDAGVLADRSLDAENCPDCEAAQRAGIKSFRPLVRYASAAVKYAVQQGGWDVAIPFSAAVQIWAYPATRAKILSDLTKAEGRDLCMYDIRLGPCKRENFQSYEIAALGSRKPAYLDHREYIGELLKTEGNMPTDEQLQAACGRVTERQYMVEDIKRAEQLWARALGGGESETLGAEFGGAADLGAGLDELMSSTGNAAMPAPPVPQPGPEALKQATAQAEAAGTVHAGVTDELAALMGTSEPEAPAAPVAAATPQAESVFPPEEAPRETGEDIDFEELMGTPDGP